MFFTSTAYLEQASSRNSSASASLTPLLCSNSCKRQTPRHSSMILLLRRDSATVQCLRMRRLSSHLLMLHLSLYQPCPFSQTPIRLYLCYTPAVLLLVAPNSSLAVPAGLMAWYTSPIRSADRPTRTSRMSVRGCKLPIFLSSRTSC